MPTLESPVREVSPSLQPLPSPKTTDVSPTVVSGEAGRERSNAERTKEEWTQQAFPAMFEAQVERTPDAVALRFKDERLTYAELNAKANRLARFLQREGVGPETLVALCVERSAEMLMGLLAILKAGGTYLPLDILYPKDRIALMLDDAQAPLLLTQTSLLDHLPDTAARKICLDKIGQENETDALAAFSPENLPFPATTDNLAYVIYTSGSTGKPKGVQITHRNLSNLLWDMRARLELTECDVFVAVTTISFDIAALELFTPPISGAAVVIAPRETVGDGHALAALIADVHGTIMQATPATWRLLTETGWQGGQGFKILCGGEPLPPALAHALLRGGTDVWNVYGPTETTIWSTAALLKNDTERITIGGPIANTTIYILDDENQIAPAGEIGQLYIGGAGVARGYFNRPELTAERFVPDPFSAEPQARMYFTGDLARWLPDGNLEFLGRIDHQVKIRGFRIELGEIEAALGSHPAIRGAVVTAREDIPGDIRLIAYLTLRDGTSDKNTAEKTGHLFSELRSRAAERLPDYMVPARFMALEEFPLTPNGKVDRKALPAPDESIIRENPPVAPQNWLEMQLVEIWEKALGVTPLGIDDDFFEIGGHSLLAARIFAAIGQTLGKDLALTSLLEAPTIRRQAQMLENADDEAQWNSLVALKPEGSRPPIFGIHAAQGTTLFYRPLIQHLHAEQPFYGLQQQGLNGKRTSLTRIEDMAAHYIKEIQRVQPHGPYRLTGYCFGGLVAYEIAQQLHQQGEKTELLALINSPTPDFDFSRGAPGIPDNKEETASVETAPPKPLPQYGGGFFGRVQRGLGRRYQMIRLWLRAQERRIVPLMTLARGKTIPWEHRRAYASSLNDRAQRWYKPSPYPGRLTVIRGAGMFFDETTGWAGKAQEGIESHEISGRQRGWIDTMMEPHVQQVAAILERGASKPVD